MAYRNARKTLEAYLLRRRKTLRREARLIMVGLSTCSSADELTDRANVQSGRDKCAAKYWCVTIGRNDCFDFERTGHEKPCENREKQIYVE